MIFAFRPLGIFDCNQMSTTLITGLTAAQKTNLAESRSNFFDSDENEIFMGLNNSIFSSGD